MPNKLLSEQIRLVVWIIVAVAALNWALVEFVSTDLLVDVLGLTGDTLTAAYGVIGAAAAVNLYNIGVGVMEG